MLRVMYISVLIENFMIRYVCERLWSILACFFDLKLVIINKIVFWWHFTVLIHTYGNWHKLPYLSKQRPSHYLNPTIGLVCLCSVLSLLRKHCFLLRPPNPPVYTILNHFWHRIPRKLTQHVDSDPASIKEWLGWPPAPLNKTKALFEPSLYTNYGMYMLGTAAVVYFGEFTSLSLTRRSKVCGRPHQISVWGYGGCGLVKIFGQWYRRDSCLCAGILVGMCAGGVT